MNVHLTRPDFMSRVHTPRPCTALVVGASSGIGRATAVALAQQGHRVIAAARRATLLSELDSVHPLELDVTDPASVARAWDALLEVTAGYGVDVLVNCAGDILAATVEECCDNDVLRLFETNVFGMLRVVRAALPEMRARRFGRIVNISSILGRVTVPGMGIYCATKYAVESISDALRLEVSDFGIKVILVEPSVVQTDLTDRMLEHHAAASEPLDVYAALDTHILDISRKMSHTAITADVVADTIANAVGRQHPRTRYVVPLRTDASLGLIAHMPGRLSDLVIRAAYHLPKLA